MMIMVVGGGGPEEFTECTKPKISETLIQPPPNSKSLQSCPTLCDPRDGSPPGSLVPGILQGRTLEWVAIFFSHIYTTMCETDI